MTDPIRLAPGERRALLRSAGYRIAGTPIVALLGLANTAIIVRQTGSAVFGLVSLIATVTLLFPFADLGIGATVLSASAQLADDPSAADVVRRAYRVLFGVAAGLTVAAFTLLATGSWTVLTGLSSGPQDGWAITVAAVLFALTIPAGLGVRILIGIDRNELATLVLMSCPAFALLTTLALSAAGVRPIWYCVSALVGVLAGQSVGTVAALRLSGLGRSAFAPVPEPRTRLLAGSVWLFVVGVGLPAGLQSGRLLLSHLSTPDELSRYALIAQIYGVIWQVISTAGLAYWPVFVKRRGASAETVRIWWRITGMFVGAAALGAVALAALGPWAAAILSGGRIDVSYQLALAFGALLLVQSTHLPANVLLTKPNEARWQAGWTVVMAALSIGLGIAVAARYGAVGVVCAAALGTLLAQVVPDLVWVPRLVRGRSAGRHRRPDGR
ncbi:oligosaccharide flippase family protein [Nocardia sp. ET3-3]|uniref:Oligosaccharide flippase family protein n=1 Tax=Nocardia terrae TaxID=2675851 RepID=A0A7K1USR9_9NOCA|nr:oligosaccharide flippase family protein [Nocardia terrae]MVU77321.1 oligosaccharide flippase family protein [Nocardia terrae]